MAVTRKEQIASGKKVTPLTREELFLAGKTIVPLTEEERFWKSAFSGSQGGGDEDSNVVAPEQTVTISDSPVALVLAPGYSVPESTPLNWDVLINGQSAEYEPNTYRSYMVTIGQDQAALVRVQNGDVRFGTINGQTGQVVPGTYTVKITENPGDEN